MEKNSLQPFFEVLLGKFNFCLLPKNIVSRLGFRLPNLFYFSPQSQILVLEKEHSRKNVSKSGPDSFFWYLKIVLIFFIFLVSINSFAQTSPADCKTGCTSNDVQIQNAYLSDADGNKLPSNFVCPISGSAVVYLTLELTTKTPRIGVVIYTNIKNFTPPSTIGSSITTFSQCFGTNLNQPTNKVTFLQTFNWTCGTPIVLTDVFIGWGTGNTNFCTGTGFQCPATSSKCYALPPGQYIPIQTPSANTASATRCSTQPNGTTAVFDLTSLNSTVIGSQTNVNVTWYSDSNLNTEITNTTSYTSPSGNVYAKVSSNTAPYPFSTSIVTLTVNPTPAVSSAATGSVCSGVAQNYDITSAVSGTTYSWSRAAVTGISNTAVSGQTGNPITETLINTTSAPVNVIYLITPTANGCAGAVFTYTVTVNPNPSASAGTAPAAQCAAISGGNDFNLSGSFSNGAALWTIQSATGSAAGSVTNGGTTASPTVHVTGVGTVTCLLTVTSNKTPSCGNTTSTVIVTVNPNPTVNAGADFTKTCTTNVDGKQIGEDNNNDFTYSWNPSTDLSNSGISNPVANPSTTTAYTVTKTNKTTGCSGTDSVTVTVNTDAPNAPTFCAVQPSLCGSAGSVTILSPASGTGYEYSIDNGLNWQSSTVFSPLAAGSVTGIKVKNTNTGCVSSPADCGASNCQSSAKIANPDTKTTSKIAPVEETPVTSKTETAGFEAYPVPFKNQLTIKYKFSYISDVIIEVFNTNGSMVHSKADTNSYFDKEITLNYNFNTGTQQVYIVKLTTKLGHSERKVISSY
jgi:hypothetical protein